MKTVRFLLGLFVWLVLAALLAGVEGEKAQISAFVFLLVSLAFWCLWPIFAGEKTHTEIIHARQQKSLQRFHKMRARDIREREHTAWWKALGIGK